MHSFVSGTWSILCIHVSVRTKPRHTSPNSALGVDTISSQLFSLKLTFFFFLFSRLHLISVLEDLCEIEVNSQKQVWAVFVKIMAFLPNPQKIPIIFACWVKAWSTYYVTGKTRGTRHVCHCLAVFTQVHNQTAQNSKHRYSTSCCIEGFDDTCEGSRSQCIKHETNKKRLTDTTNTILERATLYFIERGCKTRVRDKVTQER